MSKSTPADSAEKIELEIPCSSEFVTIARKAVEGLCSRLPISAREAGDITLAVGEACTNAVKFSSAERAPIRITCAMRGSSLEIVVKNRGTRFGISREKTCMPSACQLEKGGMGLYVIGQVMDDLKVSTRNGVTALRMVKKLKK